MESTPCVLKESGKEKFRITKMRKGMSVNQESFLFFKARESSKTNQKVKREKIVDPKKGASPI